MSHSSIKSKSAQREAEYTLNNCMIHKDFWIVNNDQNNIDMLQDVLDVLYGSYKNCYTAEITVSQSSSRLTIQCNVCNSNLSSYDPFISHDKGKSHKKSLQQAMSKGTSQMPNLFGPVVFKKISDVDNPFQPGTLEDQLFGTSHVVLGWQFIYREIIDETDLYTCQLCKSVGHSYRMVKKAAFKHITSYLHTTRYMSVKFNVKGNFDDILQEIMEIVNMEGKLQCKIITISNSIEKPPYNKHLKNVCDKKSPSSSHHSSRSSTRSPSPDRKPHRGSSTRRDSRSRTRSRSPTPKYKSSSRQRRSQSRSRGRSQSSSKSSRSITPDRISKRSSNQHRSSSKTLSRTPERCSSRHHRSSRSRTRSQSPDRKHRSFSSGRRSESRTPGGTRIKSSPRRHPSGSNSSSVTLEAVRPPSPPSSPPRPKTPPSPVMKDVTTHMGQRPQTIEEFMQDVTRHYEHIAKQGDATTDSLKHDLEGQDLIIQVVKVLTQKLYLYGFEHDTIVKGYAESLLKKTENLALND